MNKFWYLTLGVLAETYSTHVASTAFCFGNCGTETLSTPCNKIGTLFKSHEDAGTCMYSIFIGSVQRVSPSVKSGFLDWWKKLIPCR